MRFVLFCVLFILAVTMQRSVSAQETEENLNISDFEEATFKRTISDTQSIINDAKSQNYQGILRRIRSTRPQLTAQSNRILKFIELYDARLGSLRSREAELVNRRIDVLRFIDFDSDRRAAEIKSVEEQIAEQRTAFPPNLDRARRIRINERLELFKEIAKSPVQGHIVKIDDEIKTTKEDISSWEVQTKNVKNIRSDILYYLSQLDILSENVLDSETQKAQFTNSATYVFGGMIVIVIISFFLISTVDSRVRFAIFGGQSGIQFITIFSIVIAIVLFGVLEKLDGKDLATLLSGLAGYILGRGANQDINQRDKTEYRTANNPENIISQQNNTPITS